MIRKIGFSAMFAAAAIAIAAAIWFLKHDYTVSDLKKNPQAIMQPISSPKSDNPKPALGNSLNSYNSLEVEGNNDDSIYATEEEIDAMSMEEYVAYINDIIKTLPSYIQAEIHGHQAAANKHWESLGYFNDEQRQSYASYDRDTLKALGDQGDLLALDVLAQKYLKEDRDLEKSSEIELKAVLFGSAKAAQNLAIWAKSNEVNEGGRAHIYNAMTWYKIASMMGDKLAEGFGNSTLKVKNITLSEKEWELVNSQAEAIYAQLNEKRRELGLPEFKR